MTPADCVPIGRLVNVLLGEARRDLSRPEFASVALEAGYSRLVVIWCGLRRAFAPRVL